MGDTKHTQRISEHPILSRVWAYGYNDDEQPENRGSQSNYAYNWRCIECEEIFNAWPKTVINREGRCEECYKPIKIAKHNAAIIAKHGSIADIPEVMELWHEENNLDPRQICKSSEYTAFFHCTEGGKTFKREVKNVKLGQYYCRDCAETRRRESYKRTRIENHDTCEVYPEIMEIWDWDRNKKKPTEVPAGSAQTIYCKCPHCGKRWPSSPYARKGKHPCCGNCGRKIGAIKNAAKHVAERGSFADHQPYLATWWHPTKNKFLPTEVGKGSDREAWFICERGHTFKAKICDMGTKKKICPKCKPSIHSSFMGKAVYFYLSKVTKAKSEKKIKGSLFTMDVYLPDLNTCIEYDGENYHNNERAISRDLRKNEILEQKGIRLIRILEWQGDHHNTATIFYDYDKGDFQTCMNMLCDMLALPHVEVDMKRDTPSIYKLLYPEVLENSISKVAPELKRYWDKKANKGISADKVAANSHLPFFWKCPDCGDTWSVSPAYMMRRKYKCEECGLKIRGRKPQKSNK